MKTYLVGGAVRDKLLGLKVKDRDWVVVGATVQEMLDQGFMLVGKDFPVFLHPRTHEEHALARTETKTGPGHRGFTVNADPTVTLEEDLGRRDLSINAIAEAPDGTLIDPYNGVDDIHDRVLRHVSPAFSEDPLRVLRVARFAARFAPMGFRIHPDTLALMQHITRSGELQHLVAERIWQEFDLALREAAPAVFIGALRDCGALQVILPEVDRLFGVPQPPQYHPEVDTGIHILLCLEQATRLTPDPVVRYAVLVHDVGKGVTRKQDWPSHHGHETLGLPLLDEITRRLRVPREHADIARLVCEHHTKMHRINQLRPSTALDLLESLDAFRRPQRVEQFLLACEADARGRTGLEDRDYPQSEQLRKLQAAATAVDVGKLLAQRDHPPKDISAFVRRARIDALKAVTGPA